MEPARYDLVVLGAGPAGEKAAAQAAYWGRRVAVVDKQRRPGGTVVVEPPDGDARVVAGDVIIITTGSRPFHPPAVPFDDPDVLDSDAAALLERPLRSLVVVGGGAVGCEFASIFTALGADVVLVDSGPRLLPFMDGEVSDVLAATFRAMGMRVLQGAGRADAARTSAGLQVELASGEILRPEKVIFAAGRAGNTDSLGLAEAGVARDERGRIVVDEHFGTTADGIYAAGDVIGPPALGSVSMEQARVAPCWAFDIPFKRTVAPLPPFGVYSIPEVAMVGLTEEEVRSQGIAYGVGRARVDQNTRH